jgi:flagellar biosynthesis chaperone FliJ
MEKITLETITPEQIVEMAKYIQQLEGVIKDQRGYIIQLETMIQQRNSQLKQANQQIGSQGIYTRFDVVEETKLDIY